MKTLATIFIYSHTDGDKTSSISIDPTMNKEELIHTAIKLREVLNTVDVLIGNKSDEPS